MQRLINWWQHLPETIDPVLFSAGSFELRFYGLMYVTGILVAYSLIGYRLRKKETTLDPLLVDNYIFWLIFSIIIGSRLGYVIFYNFGYFINHPLQIFLPFVIKDGFHYTGISGMSYHGGLIGALTATWFFCRKNHVRIFTLTDFIAPTVPLGYTFGRIGNFLNGELCGRMTTVPWGMYFPYAPGGLRHPSQLYEAFFEGFFLFVLLWTLRRKKHFEGFMTAAYLIGYGSVRLVIEQFREPDAQLGFVWFSFTMGQILCSVMIGLGIFFFFIGKNKKAGPRHGRG